MKSKFVLLLLIWLSWYSTHFYLQFYFIYTWEDDREVNPVTSQLPGKSQGVLPPLYLAYGKILAFYTRVKFSSSSQFLWNSHQNSRICHSVVQSDCFNPEFPKMMYKKVPHCSKKKLILLVNESKFQLFVWLQGLPNFSQLPFRFPIQSSNLLSD